MDLATAVQSLEVRPCLLPVRWRAVRAMLAPRASPKTQVFASCGWTLDTHCALIEPPRMSGTLEQATSSARWFLVPNKWTRLLHASVGENTDVNHGLIKHGIPWCEVQCNRDRERAHEAPNGTPSRTLLKTPWRIRLLFLWKGNFRRVVICEFVFF